MQQDGGLHRERWRRIAEDAGSGAPLPTLLTGEPGFQRLLAHGLMADDTSRYSLELARKSAGLDEKATGALLKKFGFRLRNTQFTTAGIPPQPEVSLVEEIWGSLTDAERTRIEYVTRSNVAKKDGLEPKDVPDQTPYAKRLTYRFLHHKANTK